MLQVRSITKRFGSLTALDDVSVEFAPGEIHAVLGENGAGKSTFMNVVAGFVRPDAGTVELDGSALPLGRPSLCRRRGVEMIHQHFMLVPEFTAAENLALARIESLGGVLNVDELARPALEKARELGWDVDPRARTADLPVGVQQRIEILKALGGDSRVLIFDEPTAVLSPEEVEDLARVLRALRDQDKIVLLIAHKLSEVMAVADRVTVLRRGKWIATEPMAGLTAQEIATWMVGDVPEQTTARREGPAHPGLRAANLRVKGDRGEMAVRGLSLEALRGRILGIGGVDGNGQVELAEAIAGVRPYEGEITWEGEPLNAEHVALAYVPQDRQEDGLAMGMTIQDNLLLAGHRRGDLAGRGFLRSGPIAAWASELIARFGVKAEGRLDSVSGLSGGNQQKVVVSRNLDRQPDLLIVANPTRGLDFRATEFVHQRILQARDEGAAVVLISTDLEELLALSDEVRFLSRGEVIDGPASSALVGLP